MSQKAHMPPEVARALTENGKRFMPFGRVEYITPEKCREFLKKNIMNRNASLKTIELYRRQMAEKDWSLNGEAIKFDWDGMMLDGQQRCSACIQSGEPFVSFVIYGLAPDAQATMDSGRVRRAADQLTMMGVRNATVVVAASRTVISIATEVASTKLGNSEVVNFVSQYPDIVDSCAKSSAGPDTKPVSAYQLGAIHYIASHYLKEKELADKFVNTLVFGTGTNGPNDYAFFYREKMVQRKMNRTATTYTESLQELIYVWNKYRENGGKKPRLALPAEVRINDFKPDKAEFQQFEVIEAKASTGVREQQLRRWRMKKLMDDQFRMQMNGGGGNGSVEESAAA